MSIINTLIKPVDSITVNRPAVHTVGNLALAVDYDNPAAEVAESAENFDVRSYFMTKGFAIDFSKENVCIGPVENLAFLVAVNYRSCKYFLKYIRENVAKKCFHINYSLSQASDSEKDVIVGLAEKFGEYGIISNVFYNRNTNVINGMISSAPRIINFLNGDYLEFYGRAVAERVVKESAQKHGVDYEIYSNVIISKDAEKHELDIVFRVGENVFWSEIKSGKFSDFDNYRKLGILMGVNPDRHILLTAEKSDEAAEVISWFYQFYVSNIENFKNKLEEMIDKAFEGGKNND